MHHQPISTSHILKLYVVVAKEEGGMREAIIQCIHKVVGTIPKIFTESILDIDNTSHLYCVLQYLKSFTYYVIVILRIILKTRSVLISLIVHVHWGVCVTESQREKIS